MFLPSVLWSWAGDGGSLPSLTSSRRFCVGVLNPQRLISLQIPREMKNVFLRLEAVLLVIPIWQALCPLTVTSMNRPVVVDPSINLQWAWRRSGWCMWCVTGEGSFCWEQASSGAGQAQPGRCLCVSQDGGCYTAGHQPLRPAAELGQEQCWKLVIPLIGGLCFAGVEQGQHAAPLPKVHGVADLLARAQHTRPGSSPQGVALARGGHPRGAPGQAQEHPMHLRSHLCRQKTDSSSMLALLLLAGGRLLLAGEGWEAPGALGPGVPAGSAAKRVLRCGGVGVPAYIMLT